MGTRDRRGKPGARTVANRRRPRANQSLIALIAILAIMIVLGVVLLAALRGSNNGAATTTPTTGPATTPISTVAPATPAGAAPTVAVPTAGVPNVPAATGSLGEIATLDPASGAAKAALVSPNVGRPAPDFAWHTAHGQSSLKALRGQEVLLVLFAPWCLSCQVEQPWLETLLQAYGDAGLRIVGVSASPYGIHYLDKGSKAPITRGDLASYRDAFQVSYPLIFDPGKRVANLYGGVVGLPTYYVIDPSGIVRFETAKVISQHDLSAQVQNAL